MKNLILSALLMLTISFAFANNEAEKVSTVDVVETVKLTNSVELTNVNILDLSLNSTKLSTTAETLGTACCTVSSGDYEVTTCRPDGNVSRACRQARRLLRRAMQ